MYGWGQYFCEVKLDPSEPLGMGASFHMPVPTLSYKLNLQKWLEFTVSCVWPSGTAGTAFLQKV